MNRFLITLFLLINIAHAQTKATTNSGREVILSNDGTWHFAESLETNVPNDSINVNTNSFVKSRQAGFYKRINIGIYLNPNEWNYSKPGGAEAGEYNFEKKSKDCSAVLITEKAEIDLESMPEVALINARKIDPDAEIIKKEYRMVNGVKILCLQMKCAVTSLKFVIIGYYYSNENGTVQAAASTTQKMFPQQQGNMEKFLNGLVVLK